MKKYLIKLCNKKKEELFSTLNEINVITKHEIVNESSGYFCAKVVMASDDIMHAFNSKLISDVESDFKTFQQDKQDNREIGRRLQKMVGRGNRFKNRNLSKEKYYNTKEIEYALKKFEHEYPNFVTRIKLPEKTWESRKSHFIKITDENETRKTGVYITAGMHGREWIPPDAVIYFANKILKKYKMEEDLQIGEYKRSFEDLKAIFQNLQLFIFPLVNPDGRTHSQTVPEDYEWRKNRRKDINHIERNQGVDINRNFNNLWNYEYYAHSDSHPMIHDIPVYTKEMYRGMFPFSEPETRNVVYVVFANKNRINYHIDIHSSGNKILYNWGNDDSQSANTDMNFMNIKLSKASMGIKKRRNQQNNYAEYVPIDVANLRLNLVDKMSSVTNKINNQTYSQEQVFDCYENNSPIFANSTNYFNSLNIFDETFSQMHSFLIECGDEQIETEVRRKIVIKEVTVALIEFCLEVSKIRQH